MLLGEADAAVVYRSDALAAEGVEVVDVPESLAPNARYQVARLEGETRRARELQTLLLGPLGRRALQRRGFTVP